LKNRERNKGTVKAVGGGAEPFFFWVQVKPKAASDAILGWDRKGFLQVQLRAVPERGAANESCRKLLCCLLKIPKTRILLEKGQVSRLKKFRITGMSREEGEILLHRMLAKETSSLRTPKG